jgi:flavin-dependent dehydrogenase
MPHSCDVAIIGAGPAGAAAAGTLASWGYSTIVCHKEPDGPALAESIPPSTRKLFDVLGLTDAISQARFWAWGGNTVAWGRDHRVEHFPRGEGGIHVVRGEFDRVLRDLAANRGARLHPDPVSHVQSGQREGGTASLTCGNGTSIDARFVLDCSGRSGVLARSRRLRRMDTTRTVALAGIWRDERAFAGSDASHTVVETYQDGWCWSVPVGPDERYVTFMVDPRTTGLSRGGASHTYRAELAKTTLVRAILQSATLEGEPWGCDATSYTASRFAGPSFLLVGDAGSFIDPLSSFGVKKALASAWLASIVTHTCLTRPAMRDQALAFFDSREQEVFASYGQQSRALAAEASAGHAHRFWTDRADPDAEESDEVERLREDPEVLRAFAAIRAAESSTFVPTGRARIEPRPAVGGREIVLEDRLIVPGIPGGIRFLRGIDLPRLASLAPGSASVPELFDAYNRTSAPAPLPDFLGALSVLVAWHVLKLK